MPQTEAQKISLAKGRRVANERRQQMRAAKQTQSVSSTDSMAQQQDQPELTAPIRFIYVARTRLLVGDTYREPGELVPEAADWLNLRTYLELGQVEQIPHPDGVERPERRTLTFAPENYDQRKPTPGPVVGERFPAPGHVEIACSNCRSAASDDGLNYVPQGQSVFQCWHCGQQQTESQQ